MEGAEGGGGSAGWVSTRQGAGVCGWDKEEKHKSEEL